MQSRSVGLLLISIAVSFGVRLCVVSVVMWAASLVPTLFVICALLSVRVATADFLCA